MDERRGGQYGEVESVTVRAHVEDAQPACALAIATYEVSGWRLA
jgi:hypothetical protein